MPFPYLAVAVGTGVVYVSNRAITAITNWTNGQPKAPLMVRVEQFVERFNAFTAEIVSKHEAALLEEFKEYQRHREDPDFKKFKEEYIEFEAHGPIYKTFKLHQEKESANGKVIDSQAETVS